MICFAEDVYTAQRHAIRMGMSPLLLDTTFRKIVLLLSSRESTLLHPLGRANIYPWA
jgi:hypothetical protein